MGNLDYYRKKYGSAEKKKDEKSDNLIDDYHAFRAKTFGSPKNNENPTAVTVNPPSTDKSSVNIDTLEAANDILRERKKENRLYPQANFEQKKTIGDRVKAFGDSLYSGLTGFNRSMWNTAKAVEDVLQNATVNPIANNGPMGAKLAEANFNRYSPDTTKGGVVEKISDTFNAIDNAAKAKVEQNVSEGKIGRVGAGVTEGVSGALPNLIMSALSPTQAATNTLQVGNQVTKAAMDLIKNPTFHFSMAQSFGNGYDEARANGANLSTSIMSATLSAVPNSIIEISGGTEKLVSNLAGVAQGKIADKMRKGFTGKVTELLKSALEEGLEEVIQYPFEGLAKKATYAPETPWMSTTEQGVINPVQQAKAGAMGATVGAILGGGGMGIDAIINRGADFDPNESVRGAVAEDKQTQHIDNEIPQSTTNSVDYTSEQYGNEYGNYGDIVRIPDESSSTGEYVYVNTPSYLYPIDEYRDYVAALSGYKNYIDMRKQGARIGNGIDFEDTGNNSGSYLGSVMSELSSYKNPNVDNDNVYNDENFDFEQLETVAPNYNNYSNIDNNNVYDDENFDFEQLEPVEPNVDVVGPREEQPTSYAPKSRADRTLNNEVMEDFVNDIDDAIAHEDGELPELNVYSGKVDRENNRIRRNMADFMLEEMGIQYDSSKSSIKKRDLYRQVKEVVQEYEANGFVSDESKRGLYNTISTMDREINGNNIKDVEAYESYLKSDFENAFRTFETRMGLARRYAKSRSTMRLGQKISDVEQEAFREMSIDCKHAQETIDEITKEALLTPDDYRKAERIAQGIESKVDANYPNANYINRYADARQTITEYGDRVAYYKTMVKRPYQDRINELIEGSEDEKVWKDTGIGLLLSHNTMERNIENIVKDKERAKEIIDYLIKPIHHNEAEATRHKANITNKVKNLNLDNKKVYEVTVDSEPIKVSESGLVQLYGEKILSRAEIENLGADVDKIEHAANVFRKIYDSLGEEMNVAYMDNGYNAFALLPNYFPHYNDDFSSPFYKYISKFFGSHIDKNALPTELAGTTENRHPGRKYNANTQNHREGNRTEYDAVRGLELYLNSAMDVIHHTNDIRKLRMFEDGLREKSSKGGVKHRIQDVENNRSLTKTEQDERIEAIRSESLGHLGNFVTEIRRYADILAGKKLVSDRDWEQQLGRGMYSISQAIEGRIASNMIGGNISSALTNVIPLTQATAEIPFKNILQGLKETFSFKKNDDFVNKSDFLTNRRGNERLSSTAIQKMQDVAGKLMESIDNTISETIVRARYNENIDRSMSKEDALNEANEYAAGLMADRSKGAMPTVFAKKNPIAKAFSMFQVEVDNQYKYMWHDLPKHIRERTPNANVPKEVTLRLFKMFIMSYLFNDIYEKVAGRRSALDPIGILNSTVGDVTGYKMPNTFDLLDGISKDDFQTEKQGLGAAAVNLGTEVAQEVPFLGGLLGGGRIPINSALPDVGKVASNTLGLLDGSVSSKKAAHELKKEFLKPAAYLLPPTAGGQARKTYEGLKAYAQGGDFTVNKDGEEQMKFAVEKNLPNLVKSAAFGKWATPEGQAYINKRTILSPTYTQLVKDAQKRGIPATMTFKIWNDLRTVGSDKNRNTGKSIPGSASRNKKKMIDEKLINADNDLKKLFYEAAEIPKKYW